MSTSSYTLSQVAHMLGIAESAIIKLRARTSQIPDVIARRSFSEQEVGRLRLYIQRYVESLYITPPLLVSDSKMRKVLQIQYSQAWQRTLLRLVLLSREIRFAVPYVELVNKYTSGASSAEEKLEQARTFTQTTMAKEAARVIKQRFRDELYRLASVGELTCDSASQALGVSQTSIHNWYQKGLLEVQRTKKKMGTFKYLVDPDSLLSIVRWRGPGKEA